MKLILFLINILHVKGSRESEINPSIHENQGNATAINNSNNDALKEEIRVMFQSFTNVVNTNVENIILRNERINHDFIKSQLERIQNENLAINQETNKKVEELANLINASKETVEAKVAEPVAKDPTKVDTTKENANLETVSLLNMLPILCKLERCSICRGCKEGEVCYYLLFTYVLKNAVTSQGSTSTHEGTQSINLESLLNNSTTVSQTSDSYRALLSLLVRSLSASNSQNVFEVRNSLPSLLNIQGIRNNLFQQTPGINDLLPGITDPNLRFLLKLLFEKIFDEDENGHCKPPKPCPPNPYDPCPPCPPNPYDPCPPCPPKPCPPCPPNPYDPCPPTPCPPCPPNPCPPCPPNPYNPCPPTPCPPCPPNPYNPCPPKPCPPCPLPCNSYGPAPPEMSTNIENRRYGRNYGKKP